MVSFEVSDSDHNQKENDHPLFRKSPHPSKQQQQCFGTSDSSNVNSHGEFLMTKVEGNRVRSYDDGTGMNMDLDDSNHLQPSTAKKLAAVRRTQRSSYAY